MWRSVPLGDARRSYIIDQKHDDASRQIDVCTSTAVGIIFTYVFLNASFSPCDVIGFGNVLTRWSPSASNGRKERVTEHPPSSVKVSTIVAMIYKWSKSSRRERSIGRLTAKSCFRFIVLETPHTPLQPLICRLIPNTNRYLANEKAPSIQ